MSTRPQPHDAELIRLWSTGFFSAKQIALKLGLQRNAVYMRAQRLGLPPLRAIRKTDGWIWRREKWRRTGNLPEPNPQILMAALAAEGELV